MRIMQVRVPYHPLANQRHEVMVYQYFHDFYDELPGKKFTDLYKFINLNCPRYPDSHPYPRMILAHI
jgi:hypothetical protein